MKVCFAGDVFLGGDLLDKSCKDLVQSSTFNSADIRVVNLEQPISDSDYIENKATLYTGSFAVKQVKDLKIDAVNLAHNHIHDKGLEGIGETIMHLGLAGISTFGAATTESKAEEPYWINSDIAVMGYCEYGKTYLSQVEVVTADKAGVNPLRIEKIYSDLDQLPLGKKAILYFHWGMEHVWLPPYNDIVLAKTLLEDDRVVSIIGMHSHRVQGSISHAGKKAYMCIGNFIFPNFHIAPPVQISYPTLKEIESVEYETRQYHRVYELTYKKWRWVNRVSLLLEFCTETGRFKEKFVAQDDDEASVKDLNGFGLYFFKAWFCVLSLVYRLPKPFYECLWRLHAHQTKIVWRLQIMCFHARQLGAKRYFAKVINFIKARF
ncbi:CapA family protein [Halopseudomonas bauzanensis]|uniref:CapA family protein n=1 Tax=Halopseudomonas bauzanensis TaxID=653930 RepID=UPI0035266C09